MSSRHVRYQANSAEKGAALVVVLIVTTILVLMMGYISKILERRIELAQRANTQLYAAAAIHAKANELTYLLATQRRSAAGISLGSNQERLIRDGDGLWLFPYVGDELRLDGFYYQAEYQPSSDIDDGERKLMLSFALQDMAGLLPLNTSDPFWLKRWLQSQYVTLSMQSALIDQLADYADPDDWQRPAGAERNTYIKEDKPPAKNFLLQSVAELHHVPAWAKYLNEQPAALTRFSLRRSPTLNLNAVPHDLWLQLWPQSADKLKLSRAEQRWFYSDDQALTLEPSLLTIADEYMGLRPSRMIRFIVEAAGQSVQQRIRIGVARNIPYQSYMETSVGREETTVNVSPE
ncbi:general secretion pathway protein GspK [Neiella sp. HB171785]|uniref:General secretion pathway protein GspK n=1 Tax=Neiella litorisoli TaxID=2771431 RepID=A0A8J6R315_9GAMM|nr:type II secretion system protein GspK [Neiella litorisoli]MBD1389800.1 general secretion pathway protein GspK [Neiella litorisoli]